MAASEEHGKATSRGPWPALFAALTSLAVHASLAGVAAIAVARQLRAPVEPPPAPSTSLPLPNADEALVVELPASGALLTPSPTAKAESAPAEAPSAPPIAALSPPTPAGGPTRARIDTGEDGHGGDGVSARARNMAARADEATVTDQLRDARDRDQEDRLLTAAERAARVEQRRAREPMELTFVASGHGYRFERRPDSPRLASLGGSTGALPVEVGRERLRSTSREGDAEARLLETPGGDRLGGDRAIAPRGRAYGAPATKLGEVSWIGAPIAKARPHVDRGNPSVAADKRGRVSDARDGDQAVSDALHSLVSMSSPGGRAEGVGNGGDGGGGSAGAGGASGAGMRASALADGDGDPDGPRDRQRTTYVLGLRKRLDPLVEGAFPKDAELDLRNGTVIVDLVIAPSGALEDVIVVRESGYPAFDRNVVTAIRGASPLPPVPSLLLPGALRLRVPVHGGWKIR
jgi:TonB family protein